jgi:methylphosphotriester-DNA--protein-cysteine methyltransferase
MARPAKYTMKHVKAVENWINKGYSKTEAIRKAGYSDPSLFYRQLKNQRIKETTQFVKEKFSFI